MPIKRKGMRNPMMPRNCARRNWTTRRGFKHNYFSRLCRFICVGGSPRLIDSCIYAVLAHMLQIIILRTTSMMMSYYQPMTTNVPRSKPPSCQPTPSLRFERAFHPRQLVVWFCMRLHPRLPMKLMRWEHRWSLR